MINLLGNKTDADQAAIRNPYILESEFPDFLYRDYGEIYGPLRTPFYFERQRHIAKPPDL